MTLINCFREHGGAALVAVLAAAASAGAVAQPRYAVFLDGYPDGDFNIVELPDPADTGQVETVRPQRLNLDVPRNQRRRFQLGNGDIHVDAFGRRRIVFGGRIGSSGSWDIYHATIDVGNGSIAGVQKLIADRRVREEDPRFSWNGDQIIYKCDGRICLAGSDGRDVREVAAKGGCELWAPAIDVTATVMAYVERCGDSDSDTIRRHEIYSGADPVAVPSPAASAGPDRFPQFTLDGEILYTHLDKDLAESSLWINWPSGLTQLFHDETESDEDPYVYRPDNRYKAFIGWHGSGYSLYLHLGPSGVVRLTDSRSNVLGPVLTE